MLAKITDSSIVLMTRATPAVLALLAGLEGRRTWIKGGGLKLENTRHNLSCLEDNLPGLVIEQEAIADEEISSADASLEKFAFKRPPDPHQLTAFQRCMKERHFGLFLEQGVGKTLIAIVRACHLFSLGKITGVLVVTKKGVHRQWIASELPKDHSAPYLADWWKGKPPAPELMVQGGELKWWSINYDALRSDKAFSLAMEFCRAHKGKLLIISDESQCIKNHSSARHRRMVVLKPFSSHRLILTGTPIAKDLTDEWAQLKWLDESILGIKYLITFKAQFCIMGGFEGRAVVGAKNLDEFKRRVAPFTHRVTKAEIGYIPKHYSEWTFDLTSEQKALIKQIKKELIAELNDGSIIPIKRASQVMAKVQQISNGFIIDENQGTNLLMPDGKNPRVIAAMEWLDAHDGKAIFWARFKNDMRLLASALTAADIEFSEYHGGINDADRLQGKMAFQDPVSDCRVFLANPQSAGTGLDGLQEACTQALYYSNSFNAIDRWQSEDRIDRRGMIGGSQYTDLIAEGSVDRYILRNLSKKKGISAMTLDDLMEIFEEIL